MNHAQLTAIRAKLDGIEAEMRIRLESLANLPINKQDDGTRMNLLIQGFSLVMVGLAYDIVETALSVTTKE